MHNWIILKTILNLLFNNRIAATPQNEPLQCILTHFNNCNFSKTEVVFSLRMVFFAPKHVGAF